MIKCKQNKCKFRESCASTMTSKTFSIGSWWVPDRMVATTLEIISCLLSGSGLPIPRQICPMISPWAVMRELFRLWLGMTRNGTRACMRLYTCNVRVTSCTSTHGSIVRIYRTCKGVTNRSSRRTMQTWLNSERQRDSMHVFWLARDTPMWIEELS